MFEVFGPARHPFYCKDYVQASTHFYARRFETAFHLKAKSVCPGGFQRETEQH